MLYKSIQKHAQGICIFYYESKISKLKSQIHRIYMSDIDIKSKLKTSDHDIFIVQFVMNCSVFFFAYLFCFALIKTVMPLTTIDSMAVQYVEKHV